LLFFETVISKPFLGFSRVIIFNGRVKYGCPANDELSIQTAFHRAGYVV
jgi:hypothetical protein